MAFKCVCVFFKITWAGCERVISVLPQSTVQQTRAASESDFLVLDITSQTSPSSLFFLVKRQHPARGPLAENDNLPWQQHLVSLCLRGSSSPTDRRRDPDLCHHVWLGAFPL